MGFPFLLPAPLQPPPWDAVSAVALYVYPHRLAHGACCPLIMCERGSAGSVGSTGSAGKVRRIKIKSAAEYKWGDARKWHLSHQSLVLRISIKRILNRHTNAVRISVVTSCFPLRGKCRRQYVQANWIFASLRS